MQDTVDSQPEVASLVDLLRWRALHEGNKRAYTFLADGDQQEVCLTYLELDRRARHIATKIHALGAAGQPVLLVLPSGLEFIAAFFGCIYAGSIAVTAYPPRPNRSSERISAIIRDSGANVVITQEKIRSHIESSITEQEVVASFNWITTDGMDTHLHGDWVRPKIDGDSVALLQYTSGSTAKPNGTIVSHSNILHNSRFIAEAFQHTSSSVVVGWLPMTHDMGLIGNMLQPLYVGCHCIFMAPEHFLIKPIRWLRAISRYQATTSGGPNFAYDYCTQRIKSELRAELDLGCWELAFSGAEPVRSGTIARFSEAFAQYGFRREAFYPCYGLAESTLIVTGGAKAAAPVERYFNTDQLGAMRVLPEREHTEKGRALIGCGQTRLDQKVVIVDPATCLRCSADQIGEIWISGSGVAQGYWRQPEKTQQVFQGYLQDTGEGPYLRSGDLGFTHDGELFISGRLKDIIIVGGTNYFPVDIEITVENCHPAVRGNCVAAVAAEVDEAERLIVVAEIDRHFLREFQQQGAEIKDTSTLCVDSVTAAIREAVSRNHDLSVYDVCLIKQSTIPKTASAKIQRHICRERYLTGELSIVEE